MWFSTQVSSNGPVEIKPSAVSGSQGFPSLQCPDDAAYEMNLGDKETYALRNVRVMESIRRLGSSVRTFYKARPKLSKELSPKIDTETATKLVEEIAESMDHAFSSPPDTMKMYEGIHSAIGPFEKLDALYKSNKASLSGNGKREMDQRMRVLSRRLCSTARWVRNEMREDWPHSHLWARHSDPLDTFRLSRDSANKSGEHKSCL